MRFSFGLIPKTADNDPTSLAAKYVDHFGNADALETASATFTLRMREANLGKGALWQGLSYTDVWQGPQDIAVVRRAIDMALGTLHERKK